MSTKVGNESWLDSNSFLAASPICSLLDLSNSNLMISSESSYSFRTVERPPAFSNREQISEKLYWDGPAKMGKANAAGSSTL